MANHVALFDQSSYPVFYLQGPQALSCLQHICANDVDVPVGNIVYSQWLNEAGGIEADVTITRLDAQSFMVVSGCASERRDWFWLNKHGSSFQCSITQAQDTAIIGVMGPRSTELLADICAAPEQVGGIDYYTSAVLRARDIEFRANRLSYVGERGYELYVTKDRASALWRRLVAAGEPLQLQPAGFHAMNACRMERDTGIGGTTFMTHHPLASGLRICGIAEQRQLPRQGCH